VLGMPIIQMARTGIILLWTLGVRNF